jgi:L-ascorbate metabolism protein UlaG (beta-lactamase superfamily)
MKLTKFVHACVLVEDDQHTALFDPSEMSWDSGLIKLEEWPKLDYVIITHEHGDHFSEDFCSAIIQKFPNVQFVAAEPVAAKLTELGAKNVNTSSVENVEVAPLAHASMSPLAPDPNVPNIAVHYKNKISHPGDNHALTTTKEILFLPLAGPWGATIDGVRMADKLKPKVIVPIHDWMWNDDWRRSMYDRMADYFQQQDIRFVKTVDGEPFEV